MLLLEVLVRRLRVFITYQLATHALVKIPLAQPMATPQPSAIESGDLDLGSLDSRGDSDLGALSQGGCPSSDPTNLPSLNILHFWAIDSSD
jgi:hypothetical protein